MILHLCFRHLIVFAVSLWATWRRDHRGSRSSSSCSYSRLSSIRSSCTPPLFRFPARKEWNCAFLDRPPYARRFWQLPPLCGQPSLIPCAEAFFTRLSGGLKSLGSRKCLAPHNHCNKYPMIQRVDFRANTADAMSFWHVVLQWKSWCRHKHRHYEIYDEIIGASWVIQRNVYKQVRVFWGFPFRRLALMRLEYGKSKKGELQMKYLQKVKKNVFIIGTTAAGCYSCTTVSRD